MNIKKLFALLLAGILLLTIAGCSNENDKTGSGAGDKNVEDVIISEDFLKYAVNADGTYEVVGYAYGGTDPHEVTIPDEFDGRAVTGIAADAFKPHKTITSFKIEAKLTYIGDYAFCDCDGLTSITIPDTVTSIGKGAFQNCDKLESVTLPAGLTSISNYTFIECKALKAITIPESVTYICDYAFQKCTSLTEVTIPASVTDIGDGAFYECSALKSATVLGSALGAPELNEKGEVVKEHKIGAIIFHGCYTDVNNPTLTVKVTVDTPFAKYVAEHEQIGTKLGAYLVEYYTADGTLTDGPNVDVEDEEDEKIPEFDADDDNWTEIA